MHAIEGVDGSEDLQKYCATEEWRILRYDLKTTVFKINKVFAKSNSTSKKSMGHSPRLND